MAFALALDPPTAPAGPWAKRLLGLTPPLRLALTAQAAGASAVVTSDARLRALLADDRLRIPVVAERPSGVALLRVPASYVVHRGLVAALRATTGDVDRDLAREPFAFDVPFGFAPVDVVDRGARAAASRALLRALRKPQDGWTSRYLNRYISLFFTRFLVATPLRPNQLSLVILVVGLAGAYLATHGTYLALLIGALLFQAQSVFDGCDGEMSRLTFRGSIAGEWLDTVGDDLTNYGFFSCAAWGLFRATGGVVYPIAGVVIVVCGVLTSAIEYRYLIRIGSGDLLKYPLGVGSAPGGSGGGLADAVAPLFKRDTFVFLTLLAAAAGVLSLMLCVFALGAVSILVAVLRAEVRMARERRQAGPLS